MRGFCIYLEGSSVGLDPEVVTGFKAQGPGWQTRMNTVLAESLKGGKKSA